MCFVIYYMPFLVFELKRARGAPAYTARRTVRLRGPRSPRPIFADLHFRLWNLSLTKMKSAIQGKSGRRVQCSRELAMLISLTSLGSSQIFLRPHFNTDAARRFCSSKETPIAAAESSPSLASPWR